MKQKYEGKDLQSLVQLGREQGYLTFDQVNDFLPPDVSSPTDLRSALESFQDMDIKVLADVPADGMDSELEAEVKEGPDEGAAAAPAADSISESSDPVRLYLREMSNFQLLSREQEVEIAKRIEAGEDEVEEEVLRCPVTLDLVIEMGARVEAGEADLHDLLEENEEATDDDEERGREANEKQLKKLLNATTKLKSLHSRIEDIEDKLKDRPKPILKTKLEKSQVSFGELFLSAPALGLARRDRFERARKFVGRNLDPALDLLGRLLRRFDSRGDIDQILAPAVDLQHMAPAFGPGRFA